jgi:hypothetical protein
MSDLEVAVTGAEVTRFAMVPSLTLRVSLTDPVGPSLHSVALRTQVRVEPAQRRYDSDEEGRLADLFGTPGRWADTLQPFMWAELANVVPSFRGSTTVELLLPCSYDLEVRANRYLRGLGCGEVPLVLLFSGTLFRVVDGRMSVTPVAWHTECHYRLPVSLWREAMDRYFPGTGWLRLQQDTIDAIGRIKTAEALPTWDDAVRHLLKGAGP